MINSIIYIIGSQLPKKIDELLNFNNTNIKKEKVYIIGNGWGAYYFAKNLNKYKYEAIIIAPNNKVLNTPKLVNLVTDAYADVEFINPHATIINDILEDIDLEKKVLITKSGSKYPYKNIVLAIGSEPNDFNIPGVSKYTYKFKTIQDANILREQISNEKNNRTIFIIGSGITGIELGSKLDSKFSLKLGLNYNINLIEGTGSILSGYNDKTKQVIENYFKQNNTQKNINIKLNHLVKSFESDKIILNENKILKYGKSDLIIWTGGVRFNGYGKTILYNTLNKITPIKQRGLDVNPNFSIGINLGIYSIGDMVGNAGPPTAQNAKNQGIWLAKYFNSKMDNKYLEINPYKIKVQGKLVHLHDSTYLESEYFSGFIPNFVNKIIEWFIF
jgi:NADH dehydrogenase FAD-containing subunit